MNHFDLVVTLAPGLDAGSQIIRTTVMIDGKPVGEEHVIDWEELYRTIKWGGEFFVWTGEYGEPLEAMIEDCVMVSRSNGVVRWEWGNPISTRHLGPDDDRPFVVAEFDANDYDNAIRSAWMKGCQLSRENADLSILPTTFDVAKLINLPRWILTPAGKPFSPTYAEPRWGAAT